MDGDGHVVRAGRKVLAGPPAISPGGAGCCAPRACRRSSPGPPPRVDEHDVNRLLGLLAAGLPAATALRISARDDRSRVA